jgi:hypothetical protein
MTHPHTALRRALLVLAGTAVLAVLTSPGSAQVGEGEQFGGNDILEAWEKNRTTFHKLLKGQAKVDADAAKIAKIAAEAYIYPVTWHTNKADTRKLQKVLDYYQVDMRSYILTATNLEYQKMFAGELTACLKKVLELPFTNRGDQPAVLHAALMLPLAAKTKHEKLDELLISLVRNPKTHDAVKNYAFKAMAEFFPVDVVNVLKPAANPAKLKRDIDRVNALMDVLGEKVGNNVTPDAFRFVRRHAVRALAQTGAPAVEFEKTRKINAPAVLGLLRVLAPVKTKHAIDPAPTLGERLDAAIGYCNIRFGTEIDPDDLYQPDVGLYLVGRHFFPDFVDAYRNDHAQGKLKPGIGRLPWKTDAISFNAALQTLVKNAKNQNIEDKVKKFVSYAKPVLDDMVAHKTVTVDPTALETMLRPKDGAVWRKTKEPNFLE